MICKTIPSGVCVCPQCNYEIQHKRGIPCITSLCPMCNIPLVWQAKYEIGKKQLNFNNIGKTATIPKIDAAICIGCGACARQCSTQAINIVNGKAHIIIEKCVKCRTCVNACPLNAIT